MNGKGNLQEKMFNIAGVFWQMFLKFLEIRPKMVVFRERGPKYYILVLRPIKSIGLSILACIWAF